MNFSSQILEVNLNIKDYIPEIREIIQFEGNNTCADCVSPDISCVCLSHLVILCEKCAYIHMKYGFDVKLLTDKQWEPDVINALKVNNNAISRQFYEYAKPSWQITPFSFDSLIVREYWINEKYIAKSFIRHDGETEEQVYKAMMNKVEEIEKKKVHEEAMRNNWYYLEPTESETKMNGPFTKHEIIGYLNHDQIDESFYCWHPSLDTWEQIIDVKELDLDKRDFKIVKDTKSILEDVTPSMLKYIPRALRGYLECRTTSIGMWKKYWAVFTTDYLNLYKSIPEKSTKPDISLRMSTDDWMIEVKELPKEKAKKCLAFEIFWTETSLSFTSENPLEVIEWVHNFRKYHLFRIKFAGKVPLFEDKLNPFRPNILNIERMITTKLKFGNLLKEHSGIFDTSLQTKSFELLIDLLLYYDSPKDVTPKQQWSITKDWKVYLGSDISKLSSTAVSKHLFHFQIEMNKNAILHLWDTTEEGRQEWITAIQKAINAKKQEGSTYRPAHYNH